MVLQTFCHSDVSASVKPLTDGVKVQFRNAATETISSLGPSRAGDSLGSVGICGLSILARERHTRRYDFESLARIR